MPLYHVNPARLAPTSVILPGNYGRILAMYVMQGVNAVYFRERVLEEIRENEFPGKPSRLTSSYSLETLEAATFYRDRIAGNTQLICEVELVNANCNRHRGDFNKVQPLSQHLALGDGTGGERLLARRQR